ncbi:hypothetical protein PR048_015814 [Dryococelus australis]|uniref:Uncharacterized protein n=1 Tax=Dryococelus australis TaxID=614101 RepID=A0ABQ9HJ36_9NEOP|nr:hypothetical protein PR048_015814 [Dryococelus australis]
MRKAGDTMLVDILNSFRFGEFTVQQLFAIDGRKVPLTGPFDEGEGRKVEGGGTASGCIPGNDSSITGNHPDVGVCKPSTAEFDALRAQGKIERRMLPLILCWALRGFKLQGKTFDWPVVDLSSHLFAKCQACGS